MNKRTNHNIKVLSSMEVADYDPSAPGFNMKDFDAKKFLNTRNWGGTDPLTGMEIVPSSKKEAIIRQAELIEERLVALDIKGRQQAIRKINMKLDTDFDPRSHTVADLLYVCLSLLITEPTYKDTTKVLLSLGILPNVKKR